MEDVNALILMFDSEDSRKTWHSRLQGAVYRASVNLILINRRYWTLRLFINRASTV